MLACFETSLNPLEICQRTGLSLPTVRRCSEVLMRRGFLRVGSIGAPAFNHEAYQKALDERCARDQAGGAHRERTTAVPPAWIEAAKHHMGRMQQSVRLPLADHGREVVAVARFCYSQGLTAAMMVSELEVIHTRMKQNGIVADTWHYVVKSIKNAFPLCTQTVDSEEEQEVARQRQAEG